ncbi:NAD(P)-binding domain-containing protein [Alsobacter sp. SYSU M60028]|uniref:NAD(P)-binding domain-containing protein n=1 Tax=Alsobacter ponti TaxID=2962936 RepID=A0ABT1LEU3_9HYPH|nr:NAD(P)-dependent oxidoreductase [Alsobacter ponti]MCP8938748.1 NAD(P)-binding domain-containing protein [Alsobacter ponti]
MTRIVIEDDAVLRLAGVLLDPATDPERRAAFAAYVRHDCPDFDAWSAQARQRFAGIAGADVVFVRDGAELLAALPGAEAVILEDLPFGPDELASATSLKVVQRFGTVLRGIDLDACRQRGVTVLSLRRRTNIAVAEHAFAMLMALCKRLHQISNLVTDERLRAAGFAPGPFDTRHTASANWGRVAGLRTLHGSRLGLIGFGEIGREMARLAVGAGMDVGYFQRTRLSAEEEAALGVQFRPWDEILSTSDVLSVHVPKTVQNLLDSAAIARMKPGAFLINVARAGAVDRTALLDGLRSGRIAGAGLDVHYVEPVPPDDEFLALPSVILTPHLAGGSRMNGLQDMSDMLAGLALALRPRTGQATPQALDGERQ